MKHLLLLLTISLLSYSLAQTCNLEAQWQLVSGFEQTMINSMDMGDDLTFQNAEGYFYLRLTEDNRNADGISMMGNYDIYEYTLNYNMNTGGMAMPFNITMNGAQSGALYTFWTDGTLTVTKLEGFSGNISVDAEMMGMPMPTFNTSEFAMLSQPGLSGTYACPDATSLMITLAADTPETPNPVYEMHYVRVE